MSQRAPVSGLKLLIVDDDAAIRTLVSRVATGWGYTTEVCDSAESALVILQTSRFNIVLTDIKMGKIDGITFAAKIREQMPSLAVVIMTGAPSPKTMKQSHDMGVVYYMQKPLDIDGFGHTLRIASAWNIGMLTNRAARRFLASRNINSALAPDMAKAVKLAIRRIVVTSGWMENLRNFAYDKDINQNPLFAQLKFRFPAP